MQPISGAASFLPVSAGIYDSRSGYFLIYHHVENDIKKRQDVRLGVLPEVA